MMEFSIEDLKQAIREVVREELEAAPTKGRKKPRAIKELVPCRVADQVLSLANGTAAALLDAGRVRGENRSKPFAKRRSLYIHLPSLRTYLIGKTP